MACATPQSRALAWSMLCDDVAVACCAAALSPGHSDIVMQLVKRRGGGGDQAYVKMMVKTRSSVSIALLNSWL